MTGRRSLCGSLRVDCAVVSLMAPIEPRRLGLCCRGANNCRGASSCRLRSRPAIDHGMRPSFSAAPRQCFDRYGIRIARRRPVPQWGSGQENHVQPVHTEGQARAPGTSRRCRRPSVRLCFDMRGPMCLCTTCQPSRPFWSQDTREDSSPPRP